MDYPYCSAPSDPFHVGLELAGDWVYPCRTCADKAANALGENTAADDIDGITALLEGARLTAAGFAAVGHAPLAEQADQIVHDLEVALATAHSLQDDEEDLVPF